MESFSVSVINLGDDRVGASSVSRILSQNGIKLKECGRLKGIECHIVVITPDMVKALNPRNEKVSRFDYVRLANPSARYIFILNKVHAGDEQCIPLLKQWGYEVAGMIPNTFEPGVSDKKKAFPFFDDLIYELQYYLTTLFRTSYRVC